MAVSVALRRIMGLRGVGRLRRVSRLRRRRSLRCLRRGIGEITRGTLKYLVELAAIQPDAPALGAIVDLDSLALAHGQRHAAGGTKHSGGVGHPGFSFARLARVPPKTLQGEA